METVNTLGRYKDAVLESIIKELALLTLMLVPNDVFCFFRNRSLAGSQNEKHQPGGTGGRSGSRDHNLHMEGTASGGDRSGDDSWNYAFADWDVDKGTPR